MRKRDKHGRPLPSSGPRDIPMKTFIENVPDAEFKDALESAPDPKYQHFLLAWLSPEHRRTSFGHLCNLFNISLQDVHELWRQHQLHRGMIQMSNHLPKVLDDVAFDAESRMEYCTRCDGTGTVSDREEGSFESSTSRSSHAKEPVRICPQCKGTKEVRVVGDRAARDLLFESIGLTGKKGPLVAIQQNFGLDMELGDVLAASQRVVMEKSG